MTFVTRSLDVGFTKADGEFTRTRHNTVVLSGLRVSAHVEKMGSRSWGMANIRVFGMTQSMMNDLSTLGQVVTTARRNYVSLFAGNSGQTASQVYSGVITQAWTDYRGAPNVPFEVVAQTGMADAIQPVSPVSHPGGADVVAMLSALATQMGLAFENNGVSGVVLTNPYFAGTAAQQAQKIKQHANINMIIDDSTLAIWPIGGSRGGQVPTISPVSGLIGYPTYTANGLDIEVEYNPSIQFGGKLVIEKSILPQVNGTWHVYGLAHDLESQTPGGRWSSMVRLVPPGFVGTTS